METKEKNEIRQKIKDFFKQKEEVVFVYLFGSLVNKEVFRDIDIAIYMDTIPDLIRFGKIQAALDDFFIHNVDLVLLNELPKKNPAFAYEILREGELILSRNKDIHTNFKSRAYQFYFDTAYLRDQFQVAFEERLKSNKFGKRDYE